uniref:FAD/NAD(P)-binding domain-containing protein n=1 Tax=Lotharella globosa TaxID=91324 RepID=A0A7S3YYD9_9EUKA
MTTMMATASWGRLRPKLARRFSPATLLFLPRSFSSSASAKPRVVVLGSGWGGFQVARDLDKDKYDVRVISPANHFLFTPLLPSTAVGTLEFRCIQEPVRTIKGLREYYQAKARSIDTKEKVVACRDIFKEREFDVPYDYLVIACGAKTNTFGTPGVEEREGQQVQFLKHLYHSRKIRHRILECFERASEPMISNEERKRLLSFIVVGGGPTSCEFTGELHDFITEDCTRWFPDLKNDIRITLVEAGGGLLGSFSQSLATYVQGSLQKRNIDIRLNTAVKAVESISDDPKNSSAVQAIFQDGSVLPFGLMVWSAGLKQVKFIDSLSFEHGPTGRLTVDDYLQIPGHEGRIFALGDCAVNTTAPLAPLAKVAQQHGAYLAKHMNAQNPKNKEPLGTPDKAFSFFNPGSMAQIGGWKGVLDFTHVGSGEKQLSGPTITGFAAWVTWRSAYWGRQVSLRNKILIPMHWFQSWVFGRDICRF